MIRTALLVLAAWAGLLTPARSAEFTLADDIVFAIPDGWRIDEQASKSTTRLRALKIVCETVECKDTEETCLFSLRRIRPENPDDAALLAKIYEAPLSRYRRIRAVLMSTSVGAEVREPLSLSKIAGRDWWVIETDAKFKYKSGLFAETYIDGRLLRATCKTCERGESRHQAARTMLESFGKPGTAAALENRLLLRDGGSLR